MTPSGARLTALKDDATGEISIAVNGTTLNVIKSPGEFAGDLVNNLVNIFSGLPPIQVGELIAFAEEIRSSPEASGAERFTLQAHSLGANDAMWARYLRPDMFGEVYALNPVGIGSGLASLLNWVTFGTVQDLVAQDEDVHVLTVDADIARWVGVTTGSEIRLPDPTPGAQPIADHFATTVLRSLVALDKSGVAGSTEIAASMWCPMPVRPPG